MRGDNRSFVAIVLSLAVAALVSYGLLHLREQLTRRPGPVAMPISHTR